MKEITVLDCENVNGIFKLTRSARSHAYSYRFLLILVSCQYNVVYTISRGVDPFFGWGKLKMVKIFGALRAQISNIKFCAKLNIVKVKKETALTVYDIVCRCILSPENICF